MTATQTNHGSSRAGLVGFFLLATALTSLLLFTGSAVAQEGEETEIITAVTCLAGNGRVDTNIVNNGDSSAVYRIELGTLSARQLTVAPGDWGRISITGRPDGDLSRTIRVDGAVLETTTLTVACDTSPPVVTSPTVQTINSCRGDNGYILFQFANDSSASVGWVIEFEGVANRSTTAAAYGATVRGVTGRPDGTYDVVFRSAEMRIEDTVTVDCDEDPATGTELLTNGDFSDGTTAWWNNTVAAPDVSGGEYCATSSATDSVPWDSAFGQAELTLVAGTNYEFSFDISGNQASTIYAGVQQSVAPYTSAIYEPIAVTTSTASYSFPFTATSAVTANAGVVFNIGANGAVTYCVDNVSLEALDAAPTLSPAANVALIRSNPIRNNAFEDNEFRDVPMDQIEVSDLTVPEDLYNETLLDTSDSGYFRTKCEISHFAYDDPIIFPNQPGRAHLHMFFGNTEANAYSTFDSLLNTGTGSCNGEDLNRTSYWVPALLDSNGDALIPFEVMVYYKNDLFRLNGANELVEPFPDNLRMVVGNGMATSPQNTLSGGQGSLPIVSFNCGSPYGDNQLLPLIPDCYAPEGGSPWSGDALEMKIAFPQCHNPADGTYVPGGAHMSYSEGGYFGVRCPDSHPNDVSSIMYRIFYSPASYGGALDDVYLSSDVRPDGTILPAGTTAHADWFGAWHPGAMDMWVENCNNTQADCEIGILDRDPMTSMVRREEGTFPRGYLARAEDLILLCPGKVLDPARPLESVANCRTS